MSNLLAAFTAFATAFATASAQTIVETQAKLETCEPAEDWTCQDYMNIASFYGERLPDTLRCFEYNKYLSPAKYARKFGIDRHMDINATMTIRKVLKLDTDNQVSMSF